MKNTQSLLYNHLNKILIILFVVDVMVIWVPMLDMMTIVYTTFLYKRSALQNKQLDLILKAAYILSICMTLYVLLFMVYFLFTDFIDTAISFFH